MRKFIIAIMMLSTASMAGTVMAENITSKNEDEMTEVKSTKKYEKTEHSVKKLSDYQKYITQHDGTEPAFNNEYWDNKEPGIYVDVVTGEPLFSSQDKFDSGTGWPSFSKPIEQSTVKAKEDKKLGFTRTEVRSKSGDSHLGHVFNDGPKEKGGMRYCINSGALRFIHKDKLKEEGYEEYLSIFEGK